MKRRQFITLLGGAAAAWPLAARAQQATVPVIGFLSSRSPGESTYVVAAFRRGLREAGFVEGQNLVIAFRWAESHYDRLPALAADLVRRQVAVMTANGPAAQPAKAATATIPIVFFAANDPVEIGLVASFNRPGGNLTGVVNLGVELGPKRLELLHELIPTATPIAVLINPAHPNADAQSAAMQAAARTLGLELHLLHASTEGDFDTVFATLLQLRAGGLVILTDPFFNTRIEQLAALAVRNAVPTIYQQRNFAAAGGLLTYTASFTDFCRGIGVYAGR